MITSIIQTDLQKNSQTKNENFPIDMTLLISLIELRVLSFDFYYALYIFTKLTPSQ